MATYTVVKAQHQPWNSDTDSEHVAFLVRANARDEVVFHARITRALFDVLTDQQVTDFLQRSADWYHKKVILGDNPLLTTDPALRTRMDSFVGDQFQGKE